MSIRASKQAVMMGLDEPSLQAALAGQERFSRGGGHVHQVGTTSRKRPVAFLGEARAELDENRNPLRRGAAAAQGLGEMPARGVFRVGWPVHTNLGGQRGAHWSRKRPAKAASPAIMLDASSAAMTGRACSASRCSAVSRWFRCNAPPRAAGANAVFPPASVSRVVMRRSRSTPLSASWSSSDDPWPRAMQADNPQELFDPASAAGSRERRAIRRPAARPAGQFVALVEDRRPVRLGS